MIAVSDSTCNAMSGSPGIVWIEGRAHVFGILFGGPASHFHYYSAKLINKLDRGKEKIIRKFINYLESSKPWSFQDCVSMLKDYLDNSLSTHDENMLFLYLNYL